MTEVLAYGSWPSTIPASLLVQAAVRLSGVEVDGDDVVWSEGRPAEGGRVALVGEGGDLLSPPYSARTLVHEYGGRCVAVRKGVTVFSEMSDQRLWRLEAGADPVALTPPPSPPRSVRYADPVFTPDGRWVVCVRERHQGGVVINDLVAVDAGGSATVEVVTAGHDFYAAPRLDPRGERLAWVCWDQPDMSWDASQVVVAPFGDGRLRGEPHTVAGGRGAAEGRDESVSQPRWSPQGRLHFMSDRTGWWNLYDEGGSALAPMAADCSEPDWVFGQSSYDFCADGSLVLAWREGLGARLGTVADGRVMPLALDYTSYAAVTAWADGVVTVAASPTASPELVHISLLTGATRVLRRSQDPLVDPLDLSIPRALDYPSASGRIGHCLYYSPASSSVQGPSSERPPLVVLSHGGPTARASADLDLRIQFWTTRGIAVVDVDYAGSSGYGRAYRDSLRGQWGIADVEDCVAAAAWLAEEGLVDRARMAIAGGSAGGYTTLCAVTFHDLFAAGASRYGVADLESLAADTHKFEARYLDALVGPYPEAAAMYRSRSPIHAVDRIRCPMIISQGLEDEIVPPAQSELIVTALRQRDVPVTYLAFAGEQHGFRRAETIVAVAEAELAFFGLALGFVPDGPQPALDIDNASALRRR